MTNSTIYLKSGDAIIIMWEDSVEIVQPDGNSCIVRRLEKNKSSIELIKRTPDEVKEIAERYEGLCSLRLLGSHLFSDLDIYSLRTSKDSSIMKTELRSRSLYQPWMDWGTTWNGKCLTAKILECHKTENECSLSDILEDTVDEKYFLSMDKLKTLIVYDK